MVDSEAREADVGLTKEGRWGFGHQQGRGKDWRRLNPKTLAEQMREDETRLRKRHVKKQS